MIYFDLLRYSKKKGKEGGKYWIPFHRFRVDVQDLVVFGGSFCNNRHCSTLCSVTGISVILLSQGTS